MRELTNEEALDLFADLIEPCAEILADKDVEKGFRKAPIYAVKAAIKNHKKAVVMILALVDGVPVEDYKVNVLTLPIKALELFNNPMVQQLFTFQGQKNADKSSGSVTENTEDGAE